MNSNKRKSRQLGMPYGTANARLRKKILFHLVKECNKDICYRCGKRIESIDKFSIEHKKAWFGNDNSLFWNIDNIAFSHIVCNVGAARKNKGIKKHGTSAGYNGANPNTKYARPGCRCKICRNGHKLRMRDKRARGIGIHKPL